jgi:hypothetical protein
MKQSIYEKMRELDKDKKGPPPDIVEEVEGHIYQLPELGSSNTQRLVFIRRSGGAITYGEEWAGLQTQTVLRA